MKPIISFIRQTTLQKMTSIVRKKDKSGSIRNFVDKNELDSYIKSIPAQQDVDTILYVRCCCYKDFIYAEYNDIPQENVNCECGQKVIEYAV